MPFSRSIADLSWRKTNDLMLLHDCGFVLTVRQYNFVAASVIQLLEVLPCDLKSTSINLNGKQDDI